jgi:hypothetical protein
MIRFHRRPGLLIALSTLVVAIAACQRDAPPPAAPPATQPPAAAASPAVGKPIAPPATTNTWELPGTLGPLTTRNQLDARFGKANVREETFEGAEGSGRYPALVVYPEDPRQRLELVLDADNPDAPIQELRVRSPGSRWHTTDGLHTDMRLAELVALNGAAISFYGLQWDYGGTVQGWHGGKLANPVGVPVFHRVTLGLRAGTDSKAIPTGDALFRSDDPHFADIGEALEVTEFGISWPREGED